MLGALGRFLEPLQRHPIAAQIHAVVVGLERREQVLDDRVVEVLAAEERVAGRGAHAEHAVLELDNGVFRVRSTAGDTFLGGEDFDNALVEHMLAEFAARNDGTDLRGDRMALQRLKEAAERAKHELSSSLQTDVNLPFIASTGAGPLHLQTSLTRAKLETLVEDLIQKTVVPCEKRTT